MVRVDFGGRSMNWFSNRHMNRSPSRSPETVPARGPFSESSADGERPYIEWPRQAPDGSWNPWPDINAPRTARESPDKPPATSRAEDRRQFLGDFIARHSNRETSVHSSAVARFVQYYPHLKPQADQAQLVVSISAEAGRDAHMQLSVPANASVATLKEAYLEELYLDGSTGQWKGGVPPVIAAVCVSDVHASDAELVAELIVNQTVIEGRTPSIVVQEVTPHSALAALATCCKQFAQPIQG